MKNQVYILLIFLSTFASCTKEPMVYEGNQNSFVLNVVGASFCEQNNNLYLLSDHPNQLTIFNINTKTFQSINLTDSPTCITINLDGKFAAIGHLNKISIVDLTTNTIKKQIALPLRVYNLVFTDSNNLYANSSIKSEPWLDWIDINTETSTRNDFELGYKFTMKINPSGKFLVGSTYSLENSLFFKIALQNNEPSNLRTNFTNYRADSFANNFWFSKNKFNLYFINNTIVDTNIFTMDNNYSQSVFQNINYGQSILSFAELATKNKAYAAIFSSYQYSKIRTLVVYDLSSKLLLQTIPLKDISNTTNGNKYTFQAEPRYVFSNKGEDKVIVVTHGIDELNPKNKNWGIEILDEN